MVNNKLVMKDDIMFKAFFSKKGNEQFLKSFLEVILGEQIQIKKIIHDLRLEQLSREQKYGILDLDVELVDGQLINIEMQIRNYNNIEKRTTFYASKKIAEQLSTNDNYDKLKKVIIIAILDYSFIDLPEYLTKTIRVAKEHRNYLLNNEVEYYYIELEKFRKQNPDMNNPLNQWLAFLDMERGDLLEMAVEKNKTIKEAKESYEILTGDDEIKRLTEIRLMSELEEQAALSSARKRGQEIGFIEGKECGFIEGKESGFIEGKESGFIEGKESGFIEGRESGFIEGKESGKKNNQIQTAIKLLKLNMDIEQIKEITELSEEEILKLKSENLD